MKKSLFCANCQKETEQEFTVVKNGEELVATCPCGRQIKWPGNLTKDEFAAALENHSAHNIGQQAALTEEELANHPMLKHLAEL